MSGHKLHHYGQYVGHQRKLSKGHAKDFVVATPEEFVKRFGGDFVVNKVTLRNSNVVNWLNLRGIFI